MAEHQRQLDETARRAQTSPLFSGELAWLKAYVAQELAIMHVEFNGAELEAA